MAVSEGRVNPRNNIGKTSDAELVKRLLIENYGYAPELIYIIRGGNHQKVYARKLVRSTSEGTTAGSTSGG